MEAIVTHPSHLLFMDEVGINTNQKTVKNKGGQKFVMAHSNTAKLLCSTSDHQCIMILVTAGSGQAVCCVGIFQSEQDHVPLQWATGIDVMVVLERDENDEIIMDDSHCNVGEGKYLPGGPTCLFHGKWIPTMTFSSPSNSTGIFR